jgi:uncharacterized protein
MLGRASAIYVGELRHRRFVPKASAFRYPLHMLYLDLDELERVFDGAWLWSVERRNWVSWRRSDYLGDPGVPLREAVLARVEAAVGERPAGPVRVLTQLRYLGFCFNPVTFYYCFGADGVGGSQQVDKQQVEAIVAEITNTPWNERHVYVLARSAATVAANGTQRWQFDKDFHISPFMDMQHRYDWRFSTPGSSLVVHMENHREGLRWFDATLTMRRRELDERSLARSLLQHPFMTAEVAAAIYWQAALLWLRGAAFHPHP